MLVVVLAEVPGVVGQAKPEWKKVENSNGRRCIGSS